MILEKLQSLIADQLGVDGNTITMDTNFEEDLAGIKTVGDLVRYLQGKLDM